MKVERRISLRTRVTLFFVLASSPAVAVSIGAALVRYQMIDAEIQRRAAETHEGVMRGIQAEQMRVQEAVARGARDDSLRALASVVDDEVAAARAEGLAPLLGAEVGLSIFGVVAARGPAAGTIVSSAHLATAVGDPAPPFAEPERVSALKVGFARELVAGNPPAPAPILAAVQGVADENGGTALVVYGGRRLDRSFLEMLARMRAATLVLDTPGEQPQRFSQGETDDARAVIEAGIINIAPLPGGTDPPLGTQLPASDKSRIVAMIDVSKLVAERRTVAIFAASLVGAVLLVAFAGGAWISRRITAPILELSNAARDVASGKLDVHIAGEGPDEVGELIGVFNHMVAEIADSRERLARAERVAAWRDAARQVAHEIKNPLTPMQMAMETLRKAYRIKHKDLDVIVEESTRAVLDEVRALSNIISAFSEFARLPKPKLEAVHPADLLEQASRLYGSARPGVAIEFDAAAIRGRDIPSVQADREQIGRSLINLVKNAIEAMGESGGAVTLDAEVSRRGGKEGVSLVVRDTGQGMSEDVRAKIFAPYFTTKKDGTGLGLAIVERIIAEHDGAIDVESEPGRGATFRLWIPVRRSQESAQAR